MKHPFLAWAVIAADVYDIVLNSIANPYPKASKPAAHGFDGKGILMQQGRPVGMGWRHMVQNAYW